MTATRIYAGLDKTHPAAAGERVMTGLPDLSMDELRYMLDCQQRAAQPGMITTWGIGPCGHHARGAGWCEVCLRAEIDRRGKKAKTVTLALLVLILTACGQPACDPHPGYRPDGQQCN